VDLVLTFLGVVLAATVFGAGAQLRSKWQALSSGRSAALLVATELTQALSAVDFFIERVDPLVGGLGRDQASECCDAISRGLGIRNLVESG